MPSLSPAFPAQGAGILGCWKLAFVSLIGEVLLNDLTVQKGGVSTHRFPNVQGPPFVY